MSSSTSTSSASHTNGASLEDCYTNIFALAELAGLRWRKYTHQTSAPPFDNKKRSSAGDLRNDELMKAYSRCVQAKLLCSWRRVPPLCSTNTTQLMQLTNPLDMQPNKPADLRLDVTKELIVFWYGEEPECLNNICAKLQLSEDCSKAWAGKESYKDGHMDYETRCILFHAWHNTLQRMFELEGYVRLGKWFVHPLDANLAYAEHGSPSHLCAFRLSFFIHDVYVCASVQTQRQPVLHSLNMQHLHAAQQCSNDTTTNKQPVILSPWAISGTLVGAASESNIDRSRCRGGPWSTDRPSMKRLWRAWTRYYPSLSDDTENNIDDDDDEDDVSSYLIGDEKTNKISDQLPNLVEVEIHGVRMYHPSQFVCVGRSEDKIHQQRQLNLLQQRRSETKTQASVIDAATFASKLHTERPINGVLNLQRAFEECIAPSQQTNNNEITWRMSDGIDKDSCICASCTSPMSSNQLRPNTFGAIKQAEMLAKNLQNTQRVPRMSNLLQHRRSCAVIREKAAQQPASNHSITQPPTPSMNVNTSLPPSHQSNLQMISPAVNQNIDNTDSDVANSRKRKFDSLMSPPSEMPPSVKVDIKPAFSEPVTVNQREPVLCEQKWAPLRRPRLDTLDPLCLHAQQSNTENYAVHCNDAQFDGPSWIVGSKPDDTSTSDSVDENEPSTSNGDNLPDNILEDTIAKPRPTNNMSEDHNNLHQTFLSPPASNEAEQVEYNAISQLPPTTSRILPRNTGPPSVGVIDCIYPTPPSAENHHLSPENHHLPPVFSKISMTNVDPHMSPVVLQPVPSVTDLKTPMDKLSDIYTRRQIACYSVADSKFALPKDDISDPESKRRRRGCVSRVDELKQQIGKRYNEMKYSPTQTLRVTQIRAINQQPKPRLSMQIQSQHQSAPSQSTGGIPLAVQQYAHSMMMPSSSNTPAPLRHHNSASNLPLVGLQQQQQQATRLPFARTHSSQTLPHVMSPYAGRQPNTPSPAQPKYDSVMHSPHSRGAPPSVDAWGTGGPGSIVAPSLTNAVQQQPEDLHHDSHFDASAVCVCNTNTPWAAIRGNEAGHYVPYTPAMVSGAQQQQMNIANPLSPNSQLHKCSCGFSAVRYRYVSQMSGAYAEDEIEATGIEQIPEITRKRPAKFDVRLIELIRQQSTHRDLTAPVLAISYFERQCGEMTSMRMSCNFINQSNVTKSFDYKAYKTDVVDAKTLIINGIESACAAMDTAMPVHPPNKMPFSLWAYQRAGKELRDATELDAMNVLTCVRDMLIRYVPSCASVSTLYTNAAIDYQPGPLTWRQFERRLARTSNNRDMSCRPEPVPEVVLQQERDYIAISPLSLRMWDRMLLEPYSPPKDILYIAIMPDVKCIVERSRLFFRELSKTYENHRFGKHCALARPQLPDGFAKVGARLQRQLMERGNIDDVYFDDDNGQLVNELSALESLSEEQRTELLSQLRLFARVCRQHVAPMIQQEAAFERSTFLQAAHHSSGETSSTSTQPMANDMSMPPPAVPDNQHNVASPNDTQLMDGCDGGAAASSSGDEATPMPHVLNIYIVDAFNCGSHNRHVRLSRLTSLALYRCYLSIIERLPQHTQPFIQLELISVQTLFDATGAMLDYSKDVKETVIGMNLDPGYTTDLRGSSLTRQSASEAIRSLALSVYTQTRALNADHILQPSMAKSLTGMGPSAAKSITLAKMHHDVRYDQKRFYRYACIPYALAPYTNTAPLAITINGSNQKGAAELLASMPSISVNDSSDNDHVLLVSYCLSENQRWLLATATNARGTIMETTMINMNEFIVSENLNGMPPNFSERCIGRHVSIIRESMNRLWAFVLGVLATGCHPWRLVIGRVGRIGHGELKVWAQLLHPKALSKVGKFVRDNCPQCAGMPPQPHHQQTAHRQQHDIPCILSACLVSMDADPNIRIFTSQFAADEKFGQSAKQCSLRTPHDISSTHIIAFPTSATRNDPADMTDIEDDTDMGLGDTDGWPAFNFQDEDITAGLDIEGLGIPPASATTGRSFFPGVEMEANIELQPLAVGYFISTASAAGLPGTFWSQCESSRRTCPTHLRAALHLRVNSSDMNDDQLAATLLHKSSQHSLESTHTAEVLRYVLETYNALSWLNIDMTSGDRKSCLPIHIQALMKMYRSTMVLLSI